MRTHEYPRVLHSARSWTGRAVTSAATDSEMSRLLVSGTFRTRVSAMRVTAPGTIRARNTERGMKGMRG